MALSLVELAYFTAFGLLIPVVPVFAAGPALRLLLGIAEALFFVAAVTALADLAPSQRLGEAISDNSLSLYLFANLSDRLPALWLGAGALASCAIGLTVTGFVDTASGLITGTAVLAVGVAFMTPAFYRAIMSRVGPDQRGSGAGTFSIFVDLGLGGGPMVLGLVAARAGMTAAFTAGALLALIGATGTALLATPRRHLTQGGKTDQRP